MSEPLYDSVVLTTVDDNASRVLLGAPVGGLNEGVVGSQMGLLVPDPIPTTLPAINATVYYQGVALDPQPNVLFELSCAKNIATISQEGIVTRQTNPNAFCFDSNGGVSSGGMIGSLIQVSATVLRADGSQSGVRGTINIVIQNAAARQFAQVSEYGTPTTPAANNTPSSNPEFYTLVSD